MDIVWEKMDVEEKITVARDCKPTRREVNVA